jgi:hypothetical protein
LVELRYDELVADPAAAASLLAPALDAPSHILAAALARAYRSSVGRYRSDLTSEQLADVDAEAGELLRELGYVSSAKA